MRILDALLFFFARRRRFLGGIHERRLLVILFLRFTAHVRLFLGALRILRFLWPSFLRLLRVVMRGLLTRSLVVRRCVMEIDLRLLGIALGRFFLGRRTRMSSERMRILCFLVDREGFVLWLQVRVQTASHSQARLPLRARDLGPIRFIFGGLLRIIKDLDFFRSRTSSFLQCSNSFSRAFPWSRDD